MWQVLRLAGGNSFVWRSDCRAHEFLHTAKTSTNPTIARYALTLADFDFRMEWIPGLTMIADSFSRLVITACGPNEAISLPEIVFGIPLGGRILAAKHGVSTVPASPLLLYQPAVEWVVETPCVIELEFEGELCGKLIDMVGRAEVPLATAPAGIAILDVLYDTTLYSCDRSVPDPPMLEELGVWPDMTIRESQRLHALPYLRRWINESNIGAQAAGAGSGVPIPTDLVPALSAMAKKAWVGEDGRLWKNTRRGLRVEIIDSAVKLHDVLLLCHDGMGHRQLGSVYDYFSRRYWIPAAVKFIKRHILACTVCQQFANDLVLPPPGFSPSAKEVFTHWSIDFAGPFASDVVTGCRFVIVAVEWATRWAEAEVVADATAATAAEFIYSRIIARNGCVECIQSDNGPHFINDVITCLIRTLGIRHKLSTPYYPQSNGKVERVIGTLKSMLKRTVAAAAIAQAGGECEERNDAVIGNDIKVFGVGLELDNAILEAIVVAGAERRAQALTGKVEEDEVPALTQTQAVHWSPLLHTVLWVYRASPHNATGLSPALLALGRELKLPVDITPDQEVCLLTDDDHKEIIAKRLTWITDRIDGLRELRYGRRDSTCTVQFELGQKVWKREPKYNGKGFVPVFAPRWTGPYIIHSVYDKNVYKLRTVPDGLKKVGYLKNPINGSRLKPFVDAAETELVGGTGGMGD